MNDNFAVFIITHGRADNVATLKTLSKLGYTGKWFLIIDNEDEQADKYRKNFGYDHVIMFDKLKAYEKTDSMDNFNNRKVAVYARNEAYRIAKELNLQYFLVLDDDFTGFSFRYVDGSKLRSKPAANIDKVFSAMLRLMDDTGAVVVSFAVDGDMIGGIQSKRFHKKFLRKTMGSWFCRTDKPIDFRGTMNEDVTICTTLGSRGDLFLTYTHIVVSHIPTETQSGGCTDAYKADGRYMQAFYSVMSMPSAIYVSMMSTKYNKIHARIVWENCVPKIIDEKWRREA